MRTAATQKRNSELDELEKELGLDILDSTMCSSGDGDARSTTDSAAGKFNSVVCTFVEHVAFCFSMHFLMHTS